MDFACAQSEAACEKASAELKALQDELARATAQLKAKAAVLDDQRARVTADLNAKVEAAQSELWELQGRIEKARRQSAETDASRDSLIRRLRI